MHIGLIGALLLPNFAFGNDDGTWIVKTGEQSTPIVESIPMETVQILPDAPILTEEEPSPNAEMLKDTDAGEARADERAKLSERCEAQDGKACLELAHTNTQPTERLPLLQQGCDAGNSEACQWLGDHYADGAGTTPNIYRSAWLYQMSCDGGNASACGDLAELLYRGRLGSADPQRAVNLYERACDEAGDIKACLSLGELYEGKSTISADYPRSARYYQIACDGGDAIACFNLGTMYMTRLGKPDPLRASTFFLASCEGGDPYGCYNLGYLYYSGEILDPDNEHAGRLFERACNGGVSQACGLNTPSAALDE